MFIKQKAAKQTKDNSLPGSWFRALYKLQVLLSGSAIRICWGFFEYVNMTFANRIAALQGRHTEQGAGLHSIEKTQQIKKELFVVKDVTVGTEIFLRRILTRWNCFL